MIQKELPTHIHIQTLVFLSFRLPSLTRTKKIETKINFHLKAIALTNKKIQNKKKQMNEVVILRRIGMVKRKKTRQSGGRKVVGF